HLIANLVARNAIPQLFSRLACPRRASFAEAASAASGPLCALRRTAHQRRQRPPSRRAPPYQERRTDSYRDADERRGKQFVLLIIADAACPRSPCRPPLSAVDGVIGPAVAR